MLEKYLQEIGLSDKEAVTYLALLATENASVVELANKTKIKRPTVYVILETLAKKGLVSETTVGKKTHYQAEPPERLATFVERQKIVLDERAKRLRDIIPQIKSVQRESGERPVVEYFEGKEGIVSSIEGFFDKKITGGGIAYMIYPRDLVEEIFSPEELEHLKQGRLQNHIGTKSIYSFSKGELEPAENSTRLKIDSKRYPLASEISILGDMIKISIFGKRLSGISIHSADVAQTLRSLIDLVFDQQKNGTKN